MNRLTFFLISVILLIFFISYLNFRQDDAYIFYKYAKNIAEGNGYVYNIGEKINATTSPLYTLLLAIFYIAVRPFFPDSFAVIGILLSILSIVLILYSIKKIFNDDNLFRIFALVFLSMPLLKYGFGMETFINLALISFSVFLFTRKRLVLTSLFIGLSVLARFDSILFAGIIFLYYVIKNKKIPPPSAIVIFVLIAAPWFIFSKIYFNSFLPTTIGVKLSQIDFNMHGTGLIFLKGFPYSLPGTIISVILLITGLILSLVYIFKKRINLFVNDGIKLLLIWSISLFITYAFIINAPPYQWYYTPFAIPLSIIFSVALSKLLTKRQLIISVLVLLFIAAIVIPVKTYIQGYNTKYSNYLNAALWLNKNVPERSVLGVDEIGILGYYYKQGKIIDALGLITPNVSAHLSKNDFDWYMKKYSPDYIVNDYPVVQKHTGGKSKCFWENYKIIKTFESRKQMIAIYKKKSFLNL